jgi:hypothetical protein
MLFEGIRQLLNPKPSGRWLAVQTATTYAVSMSEGVVPFIRPDLNPGNSLTTRGISCGSSVNDNSQGNYDRS